MRTAFYTARDTVRAPWRLLLFGVVSLMAAVLALGGATLMSGRGAESAGLLATSVVLCVALLASHAFMLRLVDHAPWSAVGLHANAARGSVVLRGAGAGAFAIGAPTLLLLAVGWLRFDPAADGSWWSAAGSLALILLPAALWEELFLRGYVLTVLRDVWGGVWAVVATSVVFGLLHLRNPEMTARAILLVVIAGGFLGVIRLATHSLYAAWIAHFSWNWVMAALFHVPVSGFAMGTPDYRLSDSGPDWATGGAWGPEGGIAAGAGMLLGIALYARPWRTAMRGDVTALDPIDARTAEHE